MKTREEYKEGFEIMNKVIKSAIDYSTLETVDVYDKAEKEMLQIIEDLLKPYGAEIYASRRINGGIPQISVTAYFKNGWSLYTTLHGSSFNSSWFTVFHNKQTVAEKQYTFAAEKWKKDNRYRERDIKSLSTKLEYAIEQMKNHEYDVYANKHLYPNGLPEGVKAPPLKAFNEVTSSKKNITSGRWNVKTNERFEIVNSRIIKSSNEITRGLLVTEGGETLNFYEMDGYIRYQRGFDMPVNWNTTHYGFADVSRELGWRKARQDDEKGLLVRGDTPELKERHDTIRKLMSNSRQIKSSKENDVKSKTQEVFDKAILKAAELVKFLNEDTEWFDTNDESDPNTQKVNQMNEDIAQYEMQLQDLPMDFDYGNLKDYLKNIIGSDYFSDKRCWDYLYDTVYEISNDIDWFGKSSTPVKSALDKNKQFTLTQSEREALEVMLSFVTGAYGDDEEVAKFKVVRDSLTPEEIEQIDDLCMYVLADDQNYKTISSRQIKDDMELLNKVYNLLDNNNLLDEEWDAMNAFEKIALE